MKKIALYAAVIVATIMAIAFFVTPAPPSTLGLQPLAAPAPHVPVCDAACQRSVDAETAQDKSDEQYGREMKKAQSDLTSKKIDIERDGQEAQDQAAKAQRAADQQ